MQTKSIRKLTIAGLLVAVAGPEYGGAQALVPMAALSASFS